MNNTTEMKSSNLKFHVVIIQYDLKLYSKFKHTI